MREWKGTITYLEGKNFVGTREETVHAAGGYWGGHFQVYFPHVAFFCCACGEIWARGIADVKFDYQPVPGVNWKTTYRRCPKCGGGELLFDVMDSDLDTCSHELLHRELLILLTKEGS